MSKVRREINGYIYVRAPYHPDSYRGFVAEHRLVVEKFIGRYLKSEESIHHINGNKKDNRIENLFLFQNHRQHSKFENQVRQNGLSNPILKRIEERWYVPLIMRNQ